MARSRRTDLRRLRLFLAGCAVSVRMLVSVRVITRLAMRVLVRIGMLVRVRVLMVGGGQLAAVVGAGA
jgi:hypothetical protein